MALKQRGVLKVERAFSEVMPLRFAVQGTLLWTRPEEARMASLFDFTARSLKGEEVALSRFGGKVVLVVNTASLCGFTPQYRGLEDLYRRLGPDGLVILGFPCNQFGRQEPGDSASIGKGCLLTYGVSFPIFEKVEVKGPAAHPLFQWLTRELPGTLGRQVKWNFTKFLVDRDGRPVRRFAPITPPLRLERPIRRALEG
jgi:glutathione peroxidase